METIESLSRKIEVAEELREVVKTMKTIAAVSIRQYEKAVASLRQYSHTVELGMQIVMRSRPEEQAPPRPAPGRRLGAILFGSELGMCGQFNELLVSYALDRCRELQVAKKDRAIIAVGARAVSRLEEAGAEVESYVCPSRRGQRHYLPGPGIIAENRGLAMPRGHRPDHAVPPSTGLRRGLPAPGRTPVARRSGMAGKPGAKALAFPGPAHLYHGPPSLGLCPAGAVPLCLPLPGLCRVPGQ